ncbi:MAG TPA: porphobilinogen synthase, partial [Dehalococcoidia bacterium]|nr:porphobilinogen synthase [Dehalococcoidia bacterium]
MSTFPQLRLRRLRRTEGLRDLVRETRLSVQDLVYPLFVVPGRAQRQEIPSMPGIYRLSPDMAAKEAEEARKLGIPAVLLFGIPSRKDEEGSEAYDPRGIVQEAIREIKGTVPELVVITDVCLCEYTSHGHCGVVTGGEVDNDRTLELLARAALSQAEAGA